MESETRIPVESETRDRLRARKRGAQTYDDVLREMMESPDKDGRTNHRSGDSDGR